jgi:hypothetical protein
MYYITDHMRLETHPVVSVVGVLGGRARHGTLQDLRDYTLTEMISLRWLFAFQCTPYRPAIPAYYILAPIGNQCIPSFFPVVWCW